MWTKQQVAEKLQQNPHFEKLFDEGKGKYECAYDVDGIQVKVFYTVSGDVEIWLLSIPRLVSVVQDVQYFVALAYEICDDIIRSKGGEA